MARKNESLDYSNIFEAVEFPDAYKVSYLANAIVFPTYEDVRKDFGLVRAEYHLLLCLAHYSELTAQDVARITRRPRNSISRAVHRMLDLGFLKGFLILMMQDRLNFRSLAKVKLCTKRFQHI